MESLLHVGTYEDSGGSGLVPLLLEDDGTLTPGEPYADATNGSFAARANGLVYLVDERDEGALNVLRREGQGWRKLARVSTGGAAPCHVALSPDGRRLAVANYESGSAALLALDRDGLPMGAPALFSNEGSGPDRERQEVPHAHCVRFSADGSGLYVVDLGADEVLRLTLTGNGFAPADRAWTAPSASGPRHVWFHPRRPLALVLCELAASLTLLKEGLLGLETLLSVPTAPDDFGGDNLGGHLALDATGLRAFVSNRGHDSLAVFAIESDRLQLLQRVSSGGAHPRHFLLLEDRRKLIVAHEKDGCVASFALAEDCTLEGPLHRVEIPGACFVLG